LEWQSFFLNEAIKGNETRMVFTKGVSQAVGLLYEPGGLEAA
jgi:hypothetical protein